MSKLYNLQPDVEAIDCANLTTSSVWLTQRKYKLLSSILARVGLRWEYYHYL